MSFILLLHYTFAFIYNRPYHFFPTRKKLSVKKWESGHEFRKGKFKNQIINNLFITSKKRKLHSFLKSYKFFEKITKSLLWEIQIDTFWLQIYRFRSYLSNKWSKCLLENRKPVTNTILRAQNTGFVCETIKNGHYRLIEHFLNLAGRELWHKIFYGEYSRVESCMAENLDF